MKKRSIRRRNPESGFALLLVFVMAAAIAITLYMEVPRVAFESQRDREQMAIDRGLQYQRAIQLFYRKYQLYPQTLDDLETTRNIRFLRRRYKDPLTGKDFRLLHVGPAGQLTDSLVQPPAPLPGSTTGSGPNSTSGSSQSTASSTSTNAPPPADPNNPNSNPNDPNAQPPDPLNMAARRPSDRISGAPGGAAGGTPGGVPGGDQPITPEPDPNQPQPPQPGQQPLPGQPVQQPADPNQPVTPGVPGQPGVNQTPTGQPPPGQMPSGQTPFGQTPGQQNPAFPQMPVQQGGQPGQGAPGAPQTAANLIQQILTTPRQPPSSIAGFTSGNTGGIAGVASTADGKGIHKVNDHNKYKEWEFVYDLKKDKTVVGAAAVNGIQNAQQQMQQGQTNSPFGNSTSSSPFSSSPTSAPSPAAPSNPAAPTTPPPTQ